MPKQRIRADASPLYLVGRALTALIGTALVWYGLMLALLAAKVDPGFVNSISGYRSAFDFLAGLKPADLDSTVRAITVGAGLLAFIVFGYLLLKSLPRPHLARHDLPLLDDERGEVVVRARALERAAELAAADGDAVASATAQATEGRLEVRVDLNRAQELAADLMGVRERVRSALASHGLPARPVDVTLTGINKRTRRELQ